MPGPTASCAWWLATSTPCPSRPVCWWDTCHPAQTPTLKSNHPPEEDGPSILYIDRHLVHEVTSPQAFEGLREAGRKVWRMSSIVATADHNTPTTGWENGYDGITDPISKEQITTLNDNMAQISPAAFFPFMHKRQGIVHV